MSITRITTDIPAQTGVNARLMEIICTDDLGDITTAGYLNTANLSGYTVQTTDFFHVYYGADSTDFGIFSVLIAEDGEVTLVTTPVPANTVTIDGASVIGDFPLFSDTAGEVENSGISPSDATKTKAVMASAAVLANHIACFSDTAGTVNDDAATAINGGNIQAGLSGTAGALVSFPTTASKGSLKVVAVDNTGDTVTTISNVAMGQASVVSIPDPAGATANFVVAPAALVSNNLVKASGTAGLVADAGHRLISGTTAAYGGGGTSNAYTATGLTVASVGSAVIRASTNAVSICKALPGTNTLTITFSADPGASTTVDYIYTTAAAS
jgi:hypothetical protein